MTMFSRSLGIGLGVVALAGMGALDVQAQDGTWAVSNTRLAVARKLQGVAAVGGQMPSRVFVAGGRTGANASGAVEVLTISGGRVTATQRQANLQGELRDGTGADTCPNGVVVLLGGDENSGRTRVANEAIGLNGPRGTSFLTEPSVFTAFNVVEAVGNRVFLISGRGAQAPIPLVEAFNCDAINLNADGANRGAVAGAPRIARAPIPVAVARAAGDGIRNLIVVSGGRRMVDAGPALNITQIYDTQANTWRMGPAMNVARFGHDVIRLNDNELMAVGGSDGQQVLRSTEILDTRTMQWRMSGDLPNPVFSGVGVNVGDNQIILVGGSRGAGPNDASLTEILEFSSN
jgi:hypothetical protein